MSTVSALDEQQAVGVRTSNNAGLGYLPALDGLRAVSVAAVVLYHAGVPWMHGGFFGVEVFFVVSGFLITSLLLDERARTGAISLRRFWARRARRLLPALVAVVVAVMAWTVVFGTPEQRSQLRSDLPWALLYGANWGQIVGDVPYFGAGDPPMLRHLWSLAVEEQWYAIWPLAFVALSRLRWRPRRIAAVLVSIVVAVNVWIGWVAHHAGGPTIDGRWLGDVDRINFLYLSTPTRSSGLLLGAALAFVWRARSASDANRPFVGAPARVATIAVVVALASAFVFGRVTSGASYPFVMAVVSVGSVAMIWIVLHRSWLGGVLSAAPIAAVGRRSYGIYLWHWPVFVALDATTGDWQRIAPALVITAVCSEACYRWVETPCRQGAIGRLWHRRRRAVWQPAALGTCAVAVLSLPIITADRFDRAAGDQQQTFELLAPVTTSATIPATPQPERSSVAVATTLVIARDVAAEPVAPEPASTTPSTTPSTSASTTPSTTLPQLPRRVAIVGDSQAHALAINLPAGVGEYLTVADGGVDGCSVYEAGVAVSPEIGFSNDFGRCRAWATRWAKSAAGSEVALVMLGAWDVLDIQLSDGSTIRFGSSTHDDLFVNGLEIGLAGLEYVGVEAALLEVPCMRPVEAFGQGVPPIPERAQDWRVIHLNGLLRRVAAAHPDTVTFVEGPDAWCGDPAIATDLDYRWDGVHVYQRGANLILGTITPALLAIPV